MFVKANYQTFMFVKANNQTFMFVYITMNLRSKETIICFTVILLYLMFTYIIVATGEMNMHDNFSII